MVTISCKIDKPFEEIGEEIARNLSMEVRSRSASAANELTNATAFVLRGARSGRRYLIPGTRRHYTASAPGEPPAVRTGAFRASFKAKQTIEDAGGNDFNVHSSTESDLMVGKYNLGKLLEEGTPKMAPRPHAERIVARALPNIVRLYSRPYNAR